MQYVFGYGSLLDPDSLRRTVPDVDLDACVPARATGLVRCFDLAFPNDGSQQDKAYYTADGQRPPRILLCNLRPALEHSANGICIPVGPGQLMALRGRELRYDTAPIAVRAYPGWPAPAGEVLVFIGRPEFTRSDDVTRGVLSADYRHVVLAGAGHWERQVSGFTADFSASTCFPPEERVQVIRRVDLSTS